MNEKNSMKSISNVVGISLVVAIVAAGCNKGGSGDAALVEKGKTVYAANGCANCHTVAGQGGRKAPDLSQVGAATEHTPEWIVAHVKNPKSHNPNSSMPGFEGKIGDEDMLALGAYLASLK